jgi:hypothetical protein
MNRMNPCHADIGIFVSFFPPTNKFYEDIQGDNFKQFLSSNGTTNEGQHTIAKYDGVFDKRTASEHSSDKIDRYYKLLLLVKSKIRKDNVWISFVAGLHRHAATSTMHKV